MSISKQEAAYRTIRERILTGRYTPGFRLVINQLAKELGASTIPVREAVRRLEAEGLVVFSPNAGASVAPVDESAYLETLEVLAVLEGYATAAAAPHLGPEDLQRLREITRQMESAIGVHDFPSFARLNREFHILIYERCPNAYLWEAIRRGFQRMDQIRHNVFGFIPGRAPASVTEHMELLDCIERGDSLELIERLARQHKLNTAVNFRTWAERSLHDQNRTFLR